MKPVLRSMALLAAVGIFGCKSDPSGVTPDDTPVKIVANPAVLTVAQGASKTVTIAVVDSNGNALPAEITATAGSGDITVVQDTSAELVYGPDGVPHANTSTRETRITVTGVNVNSATITVTSGDLTTTLPVVVTRTVTKIPGTEELATAPTVDVPAAGATTTFFDKGPFGSSVCSAAEASFGTLDSPCTLYKIVITDPGTVLHATLSWFSDEDLGLYVLDETGAEALDATIGAADAHGDGADGHPETGDLTFATPGTYYLGVVNFSDTNPEYFSVELSR